MANIDDGVSKPERAYRLIRARILQGEYGPGDRLVIDALAEELGISPVPVREAIRRLEAEGRVVYRHNVGARVAPTDNRRHLRLGVDVGDTSTDAVLMDGQRVIAAVKEATTPDVTGGIATAVEGLIREARVMPAAVAAVLIGTTHFARAFERHQVTNTACIRLGLPSTEGVPPMSDWPEGVRAAVACRCYLAHGGHEFDGRVLSPLSEEELHTIAADLRLFAVQSVAIAAVFSPVSAVAERQAAAMLQSMMPQLSITLSHQIGRLGLLERENAAIINACLRGHARTVVAELRGILRRLGLGAPLFLTQNDGTLMTAEFAERFPVLTFSSGPANSIRGAGFLAGLRDGIVVDAGGQAIHIGTLIAGFPREASSPVRVGGVRTNFRMPSLLSLPLSGDGHGTDTLSAPAVAVADAERRRMAHGDPDGRVRPPLGEGGQNLSESVAMMLRRAVERSRACSAGTPVILVGGNARPAGAALAEVPIVLPDYYAAANAVGAATAPVSGEVDRVVSLEGVSRQDVMSAAVAEAVGQAVAAGADPAAVRVAWAEDIPLAYLPGNVTRVRVKAIGSLAVEALYAR